MRGALLSAVVLAAACYQPVVPSGVPCSASGECPGGEPCVAGVCGGTEPLRPDTMLPDTPPETMMIVIGMDRTQLRDTEVNGYEPDSTSGDVDHFSVDGLETGLLWFDLAGVPPGLAVTKATLGLHTTDDADEAGGTVIVYRMLEDWDEAEANWANRAAGKAWSGIGARPPSRDEVPLATVRPDKRYTAYEVPLPTELVSGWLSLPSTNFGLAFVRGTSQQHVHFGSRESPTWSTLTLELRP
jgi:hypothetical protein